MKKLAISFVMVCALILSKNVFGQTYGNWSGILHTSSVTAENVDLTVYSNELNNWVHQNFAGKYIHVIKYVVYQGEKYTISIKYPRNGNDYGITFTGYDPNTSNGFSVNMQNPDRPEYWVARWNITNLAASECHNVYVITSTLVPSQEYYLKIDYPAIDDSIVDSALPNPGCPSDTTPYYWGSIGNTILVNGCNNSAVSENANSQILKLYPNPITDHLIVQTKTEGNYRILNLDGQLIKKGKLQSKINNIDISSLSKGYYLFVAELKGKIITKPLILK